MGNITCSPNEAAAATKSFVSSSYSSKSCKGKADGPNKRRVNGSNHGMVPDHSYCEFSSDGYLTLADEIRQYSEEQRMFREFVDYQMGKTQQKPRLFSCEVSSE